MSVKRKTTKIKLIPIDLSKAEHKVCSSTIDGRTIHPDIKLGAKYLAKCGGQFAAGSFSMQWYGLNFQGFYPAGHQFDAPGTNHSDWEALWEIQEV